MSQLTTILESDICADLLSALLHSLWQGLVIGILLFLFLRSKPAKSANVRYVTSLIALAATVLCVFFTWSILNYKPAPRNDTVSISQTEGVMTAPVVQAQNNITETIPTESKNIQTAGAGFNWKPYAICLWLIGAIIMLFRAICLVVGGSRLQRQCTALNDEFILEQVEQLRKILGITRRIRIAVSEHITIPGVVGFISPMLILPVSMVSGVPADALQAILAHELAHIRRYDYLVNFCQMVVEAILFFNPAVWWISRQIRIEREACCDNAGIAAIGRRIRYAEVLIGWAQKMKEQDIEYAASAIGFGQPDNSGGITERIRRIVSAEHRPQLKVSWRIAGITLIISFAALTGLWQGTNLTVEFAGSLLTPQERINKITEIENSHFTIADREYTDTDRITLSGKIRTIDNKPLDNDTEIRIRCEQPHKSGTTGLSLSRQTNSGFSSDGSFSIKTDYGLIWFQIDSDGYAPLFAGPFKTEPGGQISNLDFILDKGFTGKIQVINDSNKPIEGASLLGGYQHIEGASYNNINLTTDKEGFAILENASYINISLEVKEEGYETTKFKDIKLTVDSPVVLELKKAKPTNGVVLSMISGKPVHGATIRLLRSDTYSYGVRGAPILATTDENGHFTLNTLRDNSNYMLSVDTPDLAYKILYNVTAGQDNLEVYLSEKFNIKGQITGPLEKLDKKNGKYVINYSVGIEHDHFGYWDESKYVNVEVRDNQGYFEINEFYGNRVKIGRDSYQKELDIENDSVHEVVIDLTDKVTDTHAEYKKRQVVIKFDYPKDYPAPEGIFKFKYIDPNFSLYSYKNHDIKIIKGQGILEIPTPGKVAYENENISGYWFSEKNEIKIPYEEKPFVLTIPAIPAGLIYGEVFNHDGTKANNVLVSVVAVEKSPLMEDNASLNVKGKNSAGPAEQDSKYVISPLPLQGKYVIIANRNFSYVLSDPIELNAKMPIRQLDLTFREGNNFIVKVTDDNGKPVTSGTFIFSYNTPWIHGFGNETKFINKDGEFLITNLNPDVPGNYSILVNNVPGCRPIRKDIESFDKPLEIKLEKGYVVTGKVIDDKTGWPIPEVEVCALPEDYSIPEPAGYLDAENKTDINGRFTFTNMAKRKYELGTRTDRKYEAGKLFYGSFPMTVVGGQQEQVIIKVILKPGSTFKPRKPD
jgi:beta-lactamase regulating signal transducer with metallopeptidase domain